MERTKGEVRLLSTGIHHLDEFLGGGLDPGTIALLVETAGAGGEIFAKQFAAGPAPASPGRSIFITTEETEREIVRALERFGFAAIPRIVSITEAYSKRVLEKHGTLGASIHPVSTNELLQADSKDFLSPSHAPSDNFLDELLRPFTTGTPPSRMIVHTVDFFLGLYGLERVLDTLTALKAANAEAGGLILLVLTGGPVPKSLAENRLERIADCVIELEYHRRASQFEKFLLVKKVRNKYIGLGVAPYQITEKGFELDNLNRIL